ncbi:MAG: hypothetical protein ACLUOS_02195 [Odoribacter splanchnicus]
MDIPLATGFGSYVDNVGEVKNTGLRPPQWICYSGHRAKLIWLVSGAGL